jgi:septal ring factor EnvC (AmiA/AmiB activator)
MKVLSKIKETISSKEKLYTTPFLNFEYSQRRNIRKVKKDNTDTLRKHLTKIEVTYASLERRKEELNKEAFKRTLTEEENKQLAEIFTSLEKNKQLKNRIQSRIKSLLLDD